MKTILALMALCLGATAQTALTTIQGTDTISASRAYINNNFTTLHSKSVYCRSTTGNDTYTCTGVPALAAYTRGGCMVLDADTGNTGAATVNINSLGAKSILSPAGGALSTGDITANKPLTACYDGVQFILQGAPGAGSLTGVTCDGSGCEFANPVTLDNAVPGSQQAADGRNGGVMADSTGKIIPVDNTTTATGGHIVYERFFWSDLSDFTVNGTPPSLVNGALRLTNSTPTFDSQNFEINAFVSANDLVDFEVTYRVISVSTGWGLGIGRKSINTWNTASYSARWQSTGSVVASQAWSLYNAASGSTPGTAVKSEYCGVGVAAANDIMRITWSQRGGTLMMFAHNLTQNTVCSTSARIAINSSKFRIINFGGTYDIQAIRLISRQPIAPNVVFIGDSKTSGSSNVPPIEQMRFPAYLQSLGPVAIMAGGGDRTAEVVAGLSQIVALKPKYAVLNIGRNDLAASVSSGTWQANYQTIVNTLTAAGITVIHLMPIPEVTQSQTSLTSWINSTYPSALKIDVTSGWSNTPFLNADNIHASPEGHRFIASQILASGYIAPRAGSVYVDIAPPTWIGRHLVPNTRASWRPAQFWYANAGNTSTSETDLLEHVMPGTVMTVNEDSIRLDASGSIVGSTSTKQIRAYFNGTLIFDSTALAIGSAQKFNLKCGCIMTGSTTARCSSTFVTGSTTLVNYVAVTGLTLTGDTSLKVTGTAASTGAATDDIVLGMAQVDWLTSK